jgi:TRAP-type C4-dicarboxylate transport system permease small subunit
VDGGGAGRAGSRLDRVVEATLGLFAAAVLFIMMVLTCVDVFGRYLFSRPVAGGLEITEILVAALVFVALPLVTLREEHVMVDLFDAVTPDWMLRIQHVAASLIATLVAGALSWRLLLRAVRMMDYGDTTAVLRIPLWPLTYAMSALMALTALLFLVLAFRPPARRVKKD